MRRLFIFLLFLFYFFHLRAQPFQFRKIEGLSQNTVYSITKDRQGFLWIATANGLNRYDGVEVKIYKPSIESKSGQMIGRFIRTELLEDENERLWFSTDFTLHSLDKKKGQFNAYYVDENLKVFTDETKGKPLFANPLLLKDSLLWLANSGLGVYALNIYTNHLNHYPISILDENSRIIPFMNNGAYDGSHHFWFATQKGIFSFDMQNKKWQRHLSDRSFYSVAFEKDTLYACWEKKIVAFNTNTQSVTEILFKNDTLSNLGKNGKYFFHRLYNDGLGQLWAGDETGNIYCKKNNSNYFEWSGNINGNKNPVGNFPVYCLYNFDNRVLWVGADVIGLQQTEISPSTFHRFPVSEEESIQNLFIHSIYEESENIIWLGTYQKGLYTLNKNTGKLTKVELLPETDPKIYYGRSVPCIKTDSKGNLFTSMAGRLFIREAGENKFKNLKLPVPSNAMQNPQMWGLIEYQQGWLIYTNIGIYRIQKNNGNFVAKHIKAIDQVRISDIWMHPNGQLWVAPLSSGIWIFNSLGDDVKPEIILREILVKSFLHDPLHGLLWISSANGLIAYHLTTKKIKIYDERNGLINSFIYGSLADSTGFWISTNQGISKVEVIFNKDSVFPILTFTNFTSNDGLSADEFNTGAFFKGKSGDFYFGHSKGLVWFKPSEVNASKDIPVIRMIQVKVNGEDADTALAPEYIKQLELPWDKNNLYFKFRGIDYHNVAGIKYMYRLKGWDKEWISSNSLNEVRYNNLPPGKYVFQVRARGQSGKWSQQPYEIIINILPPFWKTWWFYFISVILFVFIIVLITRFFAQQKLRTRVAELEKQKELNKERHRISRELHDDIGAGLTHITLMSESAKNRINLPELEDISGASRELVNNMSEIVWSLNPENKTLENLFSYMREQLSKQLEYTKIDFRIDFPETDENKELTSGQLRNLLLISKEIVNNAIKYSKSGNILIQAKCFESGVSFYIEDDGEGFDTAQSYPGNGLKNIRARIKELGGRIDISAEPGQGSRFHYFMPFEIPHKSHSIYNS